MTTSISSQKHGAAPHIAITITILAVVAAIVAPPHQQAAANHRKGTYGNHGYTWFARYYNLARVVVSSDYCNRYELDAFTRVTNSTASTPRTPEFSGRWPGGIKYLRKRCDGVVTNDVDIKLNYQSNFLRTHGNYGGENHSTLAPRSWCAIYRAPYPCGYHPSVVHLNKQRFTSRNFSTAYKQRLIMHETGHSLGLGHHCTSNSIMNDGRSSCNRGAWTSVMSWQATDRRGIRDTFPNWRYP